MCARDETMPWHILLVTTNYRYGLQQETILVFHDFFQDAHGQLPFDVIKKVNGPSPTSDVAFPEKYFLENVWKFSEEPEIYVRLINYNFSLVKHRKPQVFCIRSYNIQY